MNRRSLIILLLAGSVLAALFIRQAVRGVAESHRRVCIEQLRDIEGAKEQYALEHDGAAPENFERLIPDYLPAMPACPSGGAYALGDMQTPVQCDQPGHEVAW